MPSRIHRAPRKSGFTLVEIMIVVVIIGLLAAMAIPAFNKQRQKSQATRIANDMRIFKDAFETYVMEEGTFPNYTGGGLPAALVGWVDQGKWDAASNIGDGVWEYYSPGGGYLPEIVLDTPGGTNGEIFQIVDEIIDDGSATSGSVTYADDYVLYSFTP